MHRQLSVIIPVYNEVENVRPLLKRLDSSLRENNITYEAIFIDDHSTDNTRGAVERLRKEYPVSFHSKQGKRGKSRSLIEGFSYAQFPVIAMIDGDLQYPPEAMPAMLREINRGIDIVIAERVRQQVSLLRRVLSGGFRLIFCRLLHGISQDSQSGLKMFRKRVVERLEIAASPWAFDLEFLLKARSAGYRITSVPINFYKRLNGNSKISIVRATWEIGISALKLKLAGSQIIQFGEEDRNRRGEGFHYRGNEFVHHSSLPPEESAFFRLERSQAAVLSVAVFGLGVIFGYSWRASLIGIIALLTCLYFVDLLYHIYLIYRTFIKTPEIRVDDEQIVHPPSGGWPHYTILCPLYREGNVLTQFIDAISRIDYPKDRLQVLLLLEEDDVRTLQKLSGLEIPYYVQPTVIPHSEPKTKPKALNYGLKQAIGEYVVIYDAEDIPDPLQLKKAVFAFEQADAKTVCMQAKLNFYNPQQNLLTRLFTAEYSLWFELILTGLQSQNTLIPLGGTSNHFRITTLRDLNGWDSFNVTEDCDLGVRLAKQGFKTAIINSVTLEEANSNLFNWFRQRTRWLKGYLQTYLVHMRRPLRLSKDGSNANLGIFQLIIGGKVLSTFINPLMWCLTFSYFAFRPALGGFIESLYPRPVLYMGVFSLVFGNFIYLYSYMIGSAKREFYQLVKYTLLVPFYWLMMSIAAWRAIYQLIFRPHYWDKTVHGFQLADATSLQPKAKRQQQPALPKPQLPKPQPHKPILKRQPFNLETLNIPLLETW